MKKLFILIVFINFLILNSPLKCQEKQENFECYWNKNCFDIENENIELSKKLSWGNKPFIVSKDLIDRHLISNQKIIDIINIVKQSFNLEFQTVLINNSPYAFPS